MPIYFTQPGLDLVRSEIRHRASGRSRLGEEAIEEARNRDASVSGEAMKREDRIIRNLADTVRDAVVIVVKEQSETVAIGTTVIVDIDGEERLYTIGAENESLLEDSLIVYNCPIGQAIFEKRVGDSTKITIRGKEVTIIIKEIRPPSHRYHELMKKLYTAKGST